MLLNMITRSTMRTPDRRGPTASLLPLRISCVTSWDNPWTEQVQWQVFSTQNGSKCQPLNLVFNQRSRALSQCCRKKLAKMDKLRGHRSVSTWHAHMVIDTGILSIKERSRGNTGNTPFSQSWEYPHAHFLVAPLPSPNVVPPFWIWYSSFILLYFTCMYILYTWFHFACSRASRRWYILFPCTLVQLFLTFMFERNGLVHSFALPCL